MAGPEAEAAHSECEAPARLWGAQTDEACLVGATQPRPPGRAVARADRAKGVYRTNTGEDKPRPYDVLANATCP